MKHLVEFRSYALKPASRDKFHQLVVEQSGPIGSIDLLYRSNLSRYENAATKVFRPNE